MKVFICSLTALVDLIFVLGYQTLCGICANGTCYFAKGGVTLVVPEVFLLFGPLIVINTIGVGTLVFSRRGTRAVIKHM